MTCQHNHPSFWLYMSPLDSTDRGQIPIVHFKFRLWLVFNWKLFSPKFIFNQLVKYTERTRICIYIMGNHRREAWRGRKYKLRITVELQQSRRDRIQSPKAHSWIFPVDLLEESSSLHAPFLTSLVILSPFVAMLAVSEQNDTRMLYS